MEVRRLLHADLAAVRLPRQPPETTDAQVWTDFKNGSKEAYQYIYDTYFDVLYNYGRQFCPGKELVKDCIQDVFVTLWLRRETLSDTNSIKYYLFKALKRSIVHQSQQIHRHQHLVAQIPPFESVLPCEHHLIRSQEADEQKSSVRWAVNELSARQREAIFLMFYEDMSYTQIASLLSIEPKTARNLVGKALQSLRKHLKLTSYLIGLLLTMAV